MEKNYAFIYLEKELKNQDINLDFTINFLPQKIINKIQASTKFKNFLIFGVTTVLILSVVKDMGINLFKLLFNKNSFLLVEARACLRHINDREELNLNNKQISEEFERIEENLKKLNNRNKTKFLITAIRNNSYQWIFKIGQKKLQELFTIFYDNGALEKLADLIASDKQDEINDKEQQKTLLNRIYKMTFFDFEQEKIDKFNEKLFKNAVINNRLVIAEYLLINSLIKPEQKIEGASIRDIFFMNKNIQSREILNEVLNVALAKEDGCKIGNILSHGNKDNFIKI